MKYSVRRRLLVTLLSATVLVWTGTAVVSYLDARRVVNDLFDAQLAQAAEVLMSLVRHELLEELEAQLSGDPGKRLISDLEEDLAGYGYEKKVAFQIWVGRNGTVFSSPQAPVTPLSAAAGGFSDERVENHRWRVVTLSDHGGAIRVHVGERAEVRRALIHRIALRLLGPLIVGLPLLALLIWISVGRSLVPFRQLAREVAERAPSHLQPIGHNPIPVEAKPLVDALNQLFDRLRQAFEREKRLTADAAHELRTPLAGVKTQAEVARRAVGDSERRNALEQVINGVDRTTHLVDQLLTMARLDPEVGLQEFAQLDLREVVSDVLVELSGAAAAKEIDLSLEETGGRVFGSAEALRILARNLIDNAIRYTPHGGRVAVAVISSADGVTLKVDDSGPGIPPEQRARVFERFYRGHESHAAGSGLGLSIARRIAYLHGADIGLDTSAYGGLEVHVLFPPRPNPRQRSAGPKA